MTPKEDRCRRTDQSLGPQVHDVGGGVRPAPTGRVLDDQRHRRRPRRPPRASSSCPPGRNSRTRDPTVAQLRQVVRPQPAGARCRRPRAPTAPADRRTRPGSRPAARSGPAGRVRRPGQQQRCRVGPWQLVRTERDIDTRADDERVIGHLTEDAGTLGAVDQHVVGPLQARAVRRRPGRAPGRSPGPAPHRSSPGAPAGSAESAAAPRTSARRPPGRTSPDPTGRGRSAAPRWSAPGRAAASGRRGQVGVGGSGDRSVGDRPLARTGQQSGDRDRVDRQPGCPDELVVGVVTVGSVIGRLGAVIGATDDAVPASQG